MRIHLSGIHNLVGIHIRLLSKWHFAESRVWEESDTPLCPFLQEVGQGPSFSPTAAASKGFTFRNYTTLRNGFGFGLTILQGRRKSFEYLKDSGWWSTKVHNSSDLGQVTLLLSSPSPHLFKLGKPLFWKVEDRLETDWEGSGCLPRGLCHFMTQECSGLFISVSSAFCTGPQSCPLRFM